MFGEKLTTLVPLPRLRLLRYHGILAARDLDRIVSAKPVAEPPAGDCDSSSPPFGPRLTASRPTSGTGVRVGPPLLAGKGNPPARPAVLTTAPHESVGQNAAFEVGPLDMERQSVLPTFGCAGEGFQMPGEDLVEGLLFRLAAALRGWADRCGRMVPV